MEGNLSLKTSNVTKRIPALCAFMFVVGAALEYVMCKTGFYNVRSVMDGQKAANRKAEEDDFWLRVRARREAREKLVTIKSE
mmetsp:Transcript_50035/g.116907  ORF Transcript_50035/g.116907 Transcript_50035/m.116907 type:complete len:82 (+) Transcript_50035:96-341(+)